MYPVEKITSSTTFYKLCAIRSLCEIIFLVKNIFVIILCHSYSYIDHIRPVIPDGQYYIRILQLIHLLEQTLNLLIILRF